VILFRSGLVGGFSLGFLSCVVLDNARKRDRDRRFREAVEARLAEMLANVRVARPRGTREERPN
jgi:hypothetical protein